MTSTVCTSTVCRPAAFALVVVLLILGMLVVVAVGFLSSMTTERATATAFSSKSKADAAAQAGVESAEALLQQSFRDFPDSATVWETQGVTAGGSGASATFNNDGTSLYVRAVPLSNDATQPDPGTDNRPLSTTAKQVFVRPLVSGAKFMPIASKGQAVNGGSPLSTTDDKSVDINIRRSATDTQGFIGTPPNYVDPTTPLKPKPKPFRVPWVEVKEQSVYTTVTNGPTPTPQPRTIARYAFWVEDESFKTNVNYAGIGDGTASAGTAAGAFMRRDNNKNSPPSPADLDLAGTFGAFSTLTPAIDPKTVAQNVYNSRVLYPGMLFPEPRAFMHVSDMTKAFTDGSTLGDHFRFLATTNSGSLNLSRNGGQRLNLNSLVKTTNDTAEIQKEVDKLVQTISFNLPSYGQRFYRKSIATDGNTLNANNVVSTDHANIYLYKTAANIRDYIDTDSQPTMILNTGKVAPPGAPLYAWGSDGSAGEGPNYMWAQGKERAPFLQETVSRLRPNVNGTNWQVRVDYYMEFWNMSNRDISASEMNSPFVRPSSQMPWIAAQPVGTSVTNFTPGPELTGSWITDADGIGLGQGDSPNRDYDIDLTTGVYQASGIGATPTPVSGGVVFKAGTATVITTDPDFSQDSPGDVTRANYTKSFFYYSGNHAPGTLNFATTYYCSKLVGRPNSKGGKRIFNGNMPTGNTAIGPQPRDPDKNLKPHQEDYETEVILGNSLGYFECGLATMPLGGGPVYTLTKPAWVQDHFHDYLNGGSLIGNSNTPSETGDPRANNEQLSVIKFVVGGISQADQSRYFNASSGDTPPFTLGLPNNYYLRPGTSTANGKTYYLWKDYFDFPLSTYPSTNPTADSAPAVIADGLLMSIGELGDVYDPARILGTSGTTPPAGTLGIEYSRGGGRSLKIGQHDDLIDPTPGSVSSGWAAWRLTDIFSAGPVDATVDDLILPGRINLNGIARDGGAALQAALKGFVFQPVTTSASSATTNDAYRVHGDGRLVPANAPKSFLPATKELKGTPLLIAELLNRFKRTQPINSPMAAGDTPSKETFGPLFERGELSELDILGKNLAAPESAYPTQANVDLVGNGDVNVGGDLNRSFDHTREEFFRRIVEMTCTRGNVFTAYVIGQAVTQPDPTTAKYVVNATSQLRVTFQLNPVWKTPGGASDARNADGSPRAPGFSDFDPSTRGTTAGSLSMLTLDERFAKPDHYEVQVLHVNTF